MSHEDRRPGWIRRALFPSRMGRNALWRRLATVLSIYLFWFVTGIAVNFSWTWLSGPYASLGAVLLAMTAFYIAFCFALFRDHESRLSSWFHRFDTVDVQLGWAEYDSEGDVTSEVLDAVREHEATLRTLQREAAHLELDAKTRERLERIGEVTGRAISAIL